MLHGTYWSLPDVHHLKVDPIYHPGRANHHRPGKTSPHTANTAPGKPAGNFAGALKLALAQQTLNLKSGKNTSHPLCSH